MKKKPHSNPKKRSSRAPKSAAVLVAGVLGSVPALPASANALPSDTAIAKLSSGALKRLLVNLRTEEYSGPGGAPVRVADTDHDSHVMHGSHNSFTSHGQHTSFTNQAG